MASSAVAHEPAPRLSRRHESGAGSARGLLLTVLGELVLPGNRSAWTSAFIDVLQRLGVAEKAARQALMRTAADGWLSSQRIGRRTCWTLTPDAERLLTEGSERIYGFAGAAEGWDGRWLVILARAPETERPTRHLLRTRLGWAGFGSPAPGVWVSTHPERLDEAETVLADVGVPDAQIFLGIHAGGHDPIAIVREAWDLEDVGRRYGQFLAEFLHPTAGDPLTGLIELVHAWRRFPALDPALPRQLLPEPWIGVAAAEIFGHRHAELSSAATAEWGRISATSR